MNYQAVIIIGSSGHSKVIIDIFEKENKYIIAGLLDGGRSIGEETSGYKVIGSEEDLPRLLVLYPGCELFVAIGDNWVRQRVVTRILELVPGIEFANAIHPSANIASSVKMGIGVAVMPGATVNSDTRVGDFAIINTGASLDHDCIMERFSSLAPGVSIGGNVSIGAYSAICIGATVVNGLHLGRNVVLGAGAVLLQNCGDNLILYGLPAKEIESRQLGDKYL
ncbi:MAG: acetyltransferase [Chitinophagaceae bacterium]